MPTFKDPAVDANQAHEALRGLAHASQRISSPGETYRVLGALSAGLLSLQQSLDQLAAWHQRNAGYATSEDGKRSWGAGEAAAAEEHLREAAGCVRQAHCELREAFNHHGRIVWEPGIAASPTRGRDGRQERARPTPVCAFGVNGPEPEAGAALGH